MGSICDCSIWETNANLCNIIRAGIYLSQRCLAAVHVRIKCVTYASHHPLIISFEENGDETEGLYEN